MRKFSRQQDRHGRSSGEVAYVHGPSALSPLEWTEDTAFREAEARLADPTLEVVFCRARQLGMAFARPTKK
jgi:hypothetical protein